MTVVRIKLLFNSLLYTFCLRSSTSGSNETGGCKRHLLRKGLLFYSYEVKRRQNSIVKAGPIKIHRAIDLSPAPVNLLSTSSS